jgi:thiol-disulfide isomerase/thioredoxin
MKIKNIFIIIMISMIFLVACTNNNQDYGLKEFNDCLGEKGLVIYGTEWCPACKGLVQSLGGYDKVEAIYVECLEEQERCAEETKTDYVPEIQINNEVYEGSRTLEALSQLTGCKKP